MCQDVFMAIFLQGLIPGKNYSYRVQSGSNFSEGYEFTAKRDDEVSCSVDLNSQVHTPKSTMMSN